MTSTILTERDGDVLIVTNNNPDSRNALSPDFYEGFKEVLDEAAADASVGAVVLTGAGDFFCAGGNLNRLRANASKPAEVREASVSRLHGMIMSMRECPKPIIAAVEGGAAGAGVSMALACDMIICASDAFFSVAYVKIGLTTDGGVTSFLGSMLPRQLATEFCLTGDRLPAERLHGLGLINHLVDKGTALDEAKALAARLATGPARAMGHIKMLCRNAPENTLQQQLDLEAKHVVAAQVDPEAIEGIGAFLEKRQPDFAGLRRKEAEGD